MSPYIAAAALLFALIAFLTDASADQPAVTIQGEVIMVTNDLCVVRDGNGKGVMMQLDKRTTVEGTVKAGAKVEAVLSPDGHALTITVLK